MGIHGIRLLLSPGGESDAGDGGGSAADADFEAALDNFDTDAVTSVSDEDGSEGDAAEDEVPSGTSDKGADSAADDEDGDDDNEEGEGEETDTDAEDETSGEEAGEAPNLNEEDSPSANAPSPELAATVSNEARTTVLAVQSELDAKIGPQVAECDRYLSTIGEKRQSIIDSLKDEDAPGGERPPTLTEIRDLDALDNLEIEVKNHKADLTSKHEQVIRSVVLETYVTANVKIDPRFKPYESELRELAVKNIVYTGQDGTWTPDEILGMCRSLRVARGGKPAVTVTKAEVQKAKLEQQIERKGAARLGAGSKGSSAAARAAGPGTKYANVPSRLHGDLDYILS